MSQRKTRNRKKYHRYQMDALETRTLMSVTPSVYTVSGLQTSSPVYDLEGNLWVINMAPSGISFDKIDSVTHSIVDSIDLGSEGLSPLPTSFAVGKGEYAGHIYFPDSGFGIADVDVNGQTASLISLGNFYDDAPYVISQAADGTFWFIGGLGGNQVGRWVPDSATVDYTQINDLVNGTQVYTIVANDSQSAWVGMSIAETDPNDDTNDITHKQLAYVTFDGNGLSTSPIPYDTGDEIADTRNYVGPLISDGNGGIWTSLPATAVAIVPHPNQQSPDSFLHVYFDNNTLVQHRVPITDGSTGVTGSPSDHPAFVTTVALDAAGRLWFSELEGNNYGFLNTVNNEFAYFPYPEDLLHNLDFNGPDSHFLVNVAINPTGTEVTFLNSTPPGEDTQFFKLSILGDEPTFTDPSATNITTTADTSTSLSASFTASAPAGGTYFASIDWGDTTTTSGIEVIAGDGNTYSFTYIGKTFSTPGTYNGVITISDSGNVGGGVIPFNSAISAIAFAGASTGISGAEAVPQTLFGMFTAGQPASGLYTVTINWGDDTPASIGTVMSLGDNVYSVVYEGKIFNVQGTFNGSIVIMDGSTTTGQISFNSVISDTPLVLGTTTLVNSHGKFFSLSATFSDDVDSSASWFTATISWGDGSTSLGTVVANAANPGHYFVLATHKYKKGTFNVSLTVTSHDEANLVTSLVTATPLIVS